MRMPEGMNRTIWMFWSQGFQSAPDMVQICVKSWRVRNPGWKLVELDDSNVDQYVDAETLKRLRSLTNITVVKFSNLLRLYLLHRHGGVWADATCFCNIPLDEWLPNYMASGFFAFRRHPDVWLKHSHQFGLRAYTGRSGDRIFASWFLASERGNPLPGIFFEKHLELFSKNKFPLRGSDRGRARMKVLGIVLDRNARLVQIWTRPFITKLLGTYPYFILHYHFASLITRDATCRDIWRRTSVLFLRNMSLISGKHVVMPVTDSLQRKLTAPTAYMHKLTWKYAPEKLKDDSVLHFLARSVA